MVLEVSKGRIGYSYSLRLFSCSSDYFQPVGDDSKIGNKLATC